jgi:hypothetical protein
MQNGNQKNEREEFPKSDIIPFTKEELPAVKKRIENSMRKFKEFPPDEPSYKDEESSVTSEESSGDKGKKAPYPCFFLKAVDLYILSNIPNFQGITITMGKNEDESEVLFLFPVTKRSDPEAVFTQDSTLNGETKTTSTVVRLDSGKTPCPPPPPPRTRC